MMCPHAQITLEKQQFGVGGDLPMMNEALDWQNAYLLRPRIFCNNSRGWSGLQLFQRYF